MRSCEFVSRYPEFNSNCFQHRTLILLMFFMPISLLDVLDNFPVTIMLYSMPGNLLYPVTDQRHYVQHYTHTSGPLYSFQSGVPVSNRFVTSNLHQTIKSIGLNPTLYLRHIFRIGAATEAANNVMSKFEILNQGAGNLKFFKDIKI